MSLTATITKAASMVAALGTIGGGALYLDNSHAPAEQVDRMQSAGRVQTILQLVTQAERDGPQEWICLSLHAEFASLCTESPDHYWCKDLAGVETRTALMDKAGC